MPKYIDWEPKFPETKRRARKIATLYEEGFTVQEIADKIGMDVSSVYRHIRPGLRMLATERAILLNLYREQVTE